MGPVDWVRTGLVRTLRAALPRARNRSLPIWSGIFLAAAFPPFHLILPSFFGLAPLVVWLNRLGSTRDDEMEAGRGGFLFGLVYFGLLLHWIAVAMVWFNSWAIPAYLSVVCLFAWGTKWVCRLTHRLQHHSLVPGWVAFGLAWTALEWGRAHLPGELAFPWLGLGHSLTGFPVLAGAADVVGARGLTLWLAWSNALAAAIWVARGTRRQRAHGAPERGMGPQVMLWVALVTLPMIYGFGRASSLRLESVAPVAVIQPSIAEDVKLAEDAGIDATFAAVERLMQRATAGRGATLGRGAGETDDAAAVELFVWPEMTFFAHIEMDAALNARIEQAAAGVSAPILFGAVGSGDETVEPVMPYNSAFMIEGGRRTDFRYDKRRLVPMIERVPFLPVRWFGDEVVYGGYGRGTALPLGRTSGGDAFGVLICSESMYPELAREYRQAGARFLVNITNDAWFGREAWYARTGAVWQHPAHLVMRAIENRMGIVRSANTGLSFFVDPLGRVSERTEWFEPDVRTAMVWSTAQPTVYTRVGDAVGWLSSIFFWGLLAWIRWGGARIGQRRSVGPGG